MVTLFAKGLTVQVVDKPIVQPQKMNSKTVDLRQLVHFDSYHGSSRYERSKRLKVASGASVSLPFHKTDLAGGGALLPLNSTRYEAIVDGVPSAAVNVPLGSMKGALVIDTTKLANGWRRVELGGLSGGETSPVWFVFVLNGALPAQDLMPAFDGSFGITHGIGGTDTASASNPFFAQHWKMVPTAYTPTPRPLPLRVYTPFASAVPPAQLYRRLLVPVTVGDIHRPNVSKDGVKNTCNRQSYYYSDVAPMNTGTQWGALTSKWPTMHLLDGPRGVGMLSMVTDLKPGGTKGGTTFTTPWSFGRISGDGTITTLLGFRSKSPPSHWEDTPVLELVGDWSALIAAGLPVGMHEAWGSDWWKRTLALDMTAPPINGEQPHITGPVSFHADTQNNRVLRVKYSPTDRSVPGVVSIFATGKDPFDVVEYKDKVYISWRGEHRVAEHDAASGSFVRDVLKGRALAHVDVSRFVVRDATDAAIQAEPVVLPEGLSVMDDVLSVASLAMKQVITVDLNTGARAVACRPTVGGNSRFMKICQSTGSEGPRGTYFVSSWENAFFGHPEAWLPGGTKWNWFDYGPFSCGKGGRWDALGYSTCAGAAGGRIVCGASTEGIPEYTLALPTDSAKDEAKYVAGRKQWWADGNPLEHGELGFGPYGLPLPNDTTEKSYFVNWNLGG